MTQLTSAVMLLAGLSGAAAGGPKVGDRAPKIGLERLLQAPAGAEASWDGLKGKVVVLEFWTTWCGPCVAAIPHLNELSEKYADKPVQFIAISDEKAGVIEPFLSKKKMRAWIGLDTDRSMFEAYGVQGIPHTVLVDRAGVIAGITYPMHLNEKILDDMLAGRKPSLPKRALGPQVRAGVDPAAGDAAPPLFQVLVRRASGGSSSMSSGRGRLTISGYELPFLTSMAHGIRRSRIIQAASLPEGRYDVVIVTPKGDRQQVNALLRDALRRTFGIQLRRENREMEVYTLTAKNPDALKLAPTVTPGGSSRTGRGLLNVTAADMSTLSANLENVLGKPVVDETGLTGRYDLLLRWTSGDPQSLMDALEKETGLKLTPAKRSVEVGVVRAGDARLESTGR